MDTAFCKLFLDSAEIEKTSFETRERKDVGLKPPNKPFGLIGVLQSTTFFRVTRIDLFRNHRCSIDIGLMRLLVRNGNELKICDFDRIVDDKNIRIDFPNVIAKFIRLFMLCDKAFG